MHCLAAPSTNQSTKAPHLPRPDFKSRGEWWSITIWWMRRIAGEDFSETKFTEVWILCKLSSLATLNSFRKPLKWSQKIKQSQQVWIDRHPPICKEIILFFLKNFLTDGSWELVQYKMRQQWHWQQRWCQAMMRSNCFVLVLVWQEPKELWLWDELACLQRWCQAMMRSNWCCAGRLGLWHWWKIRPVKNQSSYSC